MPVMASMKSILSGRSRIRLTPSGAETLVFESFNGITRYIKVFLVFRLSFDLL